MQCSYLCRYCQISAILTHCILRVSCHNWRLVLGLAKYFKLMVTQPIKLHQKKVRSCSKEHFPSLQNLWLRYFFIHFSTRSEGKEFLTFGFLLFCSYFEYFLLAASSDDSSAIRGVYTHIIPKPRCQIIRLCLLWFHRYLWWCQSKWLFRPCSAQHLCFINGAQLSLQDGSLT